MKRTILLFIFMLSFIISYGQCDTLRYKSPIFNTVTIHENVKYGSAAVWNIPYNKTNLYMNVYTPDSDTLTKRPLMIWVHPGGFLLGNKESQDMVALCDSFAKRGYVTATIDYRKGFNLTSASSSERAVYRGVQDLRAAIRYLKEKHEDYGIDTNYTFIGGSSAGAFSALQVVYMEQDDAPTSIEAGIGYPALGCLDCEGNDYVHAMNISGYVGLWGAIGDSSWIDASNTTPGLLVHGTADGTVPFAVGHPFGMSFLPQTHGSRSISNQLTSLNIPHSTYFVEGEGHEFHGTSNGTWDSPPTPYWDTIFNLVENHYSEILRKEVLNIQGPSVICQNDTIIFKVNTPSNYSLCWEVEGGTIIHTAGDSVQVVFSQASLAEVKVKQFSEVAAYNGESSVSMYINPAIDVDFTSSVNGMTVNFTPTPIGFMNYHWSFGDGNFSSTMGPYHTYSAPGVYEVKLTTTAINGCKAKEQKTLDFTTLSLQEDVMSSVNIYPNPASKEINVTWNGSVEGEINLYNLQGELLLTQQIEKAQTSVKLNIEKLSQGVYLMRIPALHLVKEVIVQ